MKCNLPTVALIREGIGRKENKRGGRQEGREGRKSSSWHLYQEWRKTSEPSQFSFLSIPLTSFSYFPLQHRNIGFMH